MFFLLRRSYGLSRNDFISRGEGEFKFFYTEQMFSTSPFSSIQVFKRIYFTVRIANEFKIRVFLEISSRISRSCFKEKKLKIILKLSGKSEFKISWTQILCRIRSSELYYQAYEIIK